MIKNTKKNIQGVLFTPSETDILCCFTDSDAAKPSTIAKILNKPVKTIHSHLRNIRTKINAQSNDEIALFLRQSLAFRELKNLFNRFYSESYCRTVSKKIAYLLKPHKLYFRIVDEINISAEVISEIKIILNHLGIDDNRIILNHPSTSKKPDVNFNSEDCELLQLVIAKNNKNKNPTASSIKIGDINPDIYVFIMDHEKEVGKGFMGFNRSHKMLKPPFYIGIINCLMAKFPEIIRLKEAQEFPEKMQNLLENSSVSQSNLVSNQDRFLLKSQGTNLFLQFYFLFRRYIIATMALTSALVIIAFIYAYMKAINPIVNEQHIQNQNVSKFSTTTLAYYVPPRNQYFTGRENILTRIKKALNTSKLGVISQTISGAGGIGKTQLATEFAYRAIENREYDVILWVTAESVDSIRDAYDDFSERMHINTKSLTEDQVRKAVHIKLQQGSRLKRVLFIFDNASSKHKTQIYLDEIFHHWPMNNKPHILITSRSQHWPDNVFTLDIFSQQEAFNFVKQQLSTESEGKIRELSETLNYYPLALGQAVGYIKQHTNIEDYLSLYDLKKQKYLDLSILHNLHKKSLWQTLSMTIDILSDPAKEILFMSAYLSPDNIHTGLFSHLTMETRLNALQELRKHSLITLFENGKSFKIHRLLQKMVRLMIKDTDVWLNKVRKIVYPLIQLSSIDDQKSWQIAKNWLPHALTFLDYGPQNLDTAELYHQFGIIAIYFTLFETAQIFLEKSLEIKQQLLDDPSDIRIAITQYRIGIVKFWLGEYTLAANLAKSAMKAQKTHYKNGQYLPLAFTLSLLGEIERALGHLDQSVLYHSQSLQIREALMPGKDEVYIDDSYHYLCFSKWSAGNFNHAKKDCMQAINIRENRHASTLWGYHFYTYLNMGLIEEGLGNYQSAKRYLLKAYEGLYSKYGDNLHNAISNVYTPTVYWGHLKQFGKGSIGYYENTIEFIKKTFGGHHHFVARYYYLLGQSYETNKEYKKAKDSYTQSLELAKNITKSLKHPVVIRAHKINIQLVSARLQSLKGDAINT